MIDRIRSGKALRRWRRRAGLTQDVLAATIGVRLQTIGRLEIGRIRPSLALLEELARVLQCRVRDLLVEGEPTTARRQPSLRGTPTYFRLAIAKAASQRGVAPHPDTGWTEYTVAAWHLAIHVDNYISDQARPELDRICAIAVDHDFDIALWAFLEREFPACAALVPTEHRSESLLGFHHAIEEGDFPCTR